MENGLVTLFLCGDVMLGRGVDQILLHPGDPRLRESSVRDARQYVALAESVSGRIPRPVDFCWPWGDALRTLADLAPDVRVVNLETSVTRHDEFAPDKAVHYRMNPANLPCLAMVRPDACALANNHVLDFGRGGLAETLAALERAGLPAPGAGRDADQAKQPAVRVLEGGRRVLVFSCGMASSGVPPSWAATGDRSGIHFVPDLSDHRADEFADHVRRLRRTGDIVVVSLHWGSNWGYAVPPEQVRFAHRLIDAGVDLVHGHSSHHPRPVEVYRDKLILYGCGDCINDYEGITGYERYRDDLRLLYFASLAPADGTLVSLRMVAMRARRMSLRHADDADTEWLRDTLCRISRPVGSAVVREPDGMLTVRREAS